MGENQGVYGGGAGRLSWGVILTLVILMVDFANGLIPHFYPTKYPVLHRQSLIGLREFSDGKKYYRYLNIHETNNGETQLLYVGAMNYAYRLNANDISDRTRNYAKSEEIPARTDDKKRCDEQGGNDELECENHIRSLHIDTVIAGCGIGANRPVSFKVWESNLTLLAGTYPPPVAYSGAFLCPFSSQDSFSSLYVREGNPSNAGAMYTASIIRSGKTYPVISRQSLDNSNDERVRTIPTFTNPHWLYGPTFIALFETTDFVYFFFREVSVELLAKERRVVSRVARICKNDKGWAAWPTQMKQWTTFVKARLNCSLPGEERFYFNELKDVQKVNDTFYGLFTTPSGEIQGSAICAYSINSINENFATKEFLKQDGDQWVVIPESATPNPRPATCTSDVDKLSSSVLEFIEQNPIMASSIAPINDQPIAYQENVMYSLFQAEVPRYNPEYAVFFLANVDGSVDKVVYNSGSHRSALVSQWRPFDNDNTVIRNMKLHNGFVYLGTDEDVVQVNYYQCSQFQLCTDCVRDPHCGWNQVSRRCMNWERGLYQQVFDDAFTTCYAAGACNSAVEHIKVKVPGDAVMLHCHSKCETDDEVEWYFRNLMIQNPRDEIKYSMTQKNSLVIMDMRKEDEGEYQCLTRNVWLTYHNVTLPPCTDKECIWRTEFRAWCEEFSEYKQQFNHWLCMKNQCFDEDNCNPESASAQCQALDLP